MPPLPLALPRLCSPTCRSPRSGEIHLPPQASLKPPQRPRDVGEPVRPILSRLVPLGAALREAAPLARHGHSGTLQAERSEVVVELGVRASPAVKLLEHSAVRAAVPVPNDGVRS